MSNIEKLALEASRQFVENETEYRLGFIEAEESNPKTKNFGEITVENTADGVKCLLNVDVDLIDLFDQTIHSASFDKFYSDVLYSLKNGGRIVVSGCGSSGRLAMRIENSWRNAIRNLVLKGKDAAEYEDRIVSLMTGGDYTVIRAVESFEDYIELGERQAKDLCLAENDILVGVTATAETTSILGTARQALKDGAKVWMVVCSNPEDSVAKLSRAKDVYTHPNCASVYMKCGGMAVTGSTRMQSSTIEQAIILACLEMCLDELFDENTNAKSYKVTLVEGFKCCINSLFADATVESIVNQAEIEAALYEKGGLVTYFADEYLLDVLTDTTERGPTFCTPPYKSAIMPDAEPSWSFVKNPTLDTKSAWTKCFERLPRCIEYTINDYKEIGVKDQDIKKIPEIDYNALCNFQIGCEQNEEREGKNTLATWIGLDNKIPTQFYGFAEKFESSSVMTLSPAKECIMETKLNIFEHLAMKIMINTMSTVTMAKIGRIRGNYMVYLNISNKKLIDRATRIVADLCNLDYEQANYELYLSKFYFEENNIANGSVVTETMNRLKKQNEHI